MCAHSRDFLRLGVKGYRLALIRVAGAPRRRFTIRFIILLEHVRSQSPRSVLCICQIVNFWRREWSKFSTVSCVWLTVLDLPEWRKNFWNERRVSHSKTFRWALFINYCLQLVRIKTSVWAYLIPWEYHVNSCHLRFSCSEFYADSKNSELFF